MLSKYVRFVKCFGESKLSIHIIHVSKSKSHVTLFYSTKGSCSTSTTVVSHWQCAATLFDF